MIRVNLLPQKKKRAERSEGSQLWLAVVMVVLLAEIAGLFLFHGLKSEELLDQQRKNAALQGQIDHSKRSVQSHAEIKEKLAQLRAREEAIAKLQSARSGPTAVLLELARIMTPGRGPSVDPDRLAQLRRDNPLAVINPTWDARRLWLSRFVEEQRKVRLEGLARDGEDVSELARRMNLSSYFSDVKLLPAKRQTDQKTGIELVNFSLEAKVNY